MEVENVQASIEPDLLYPLLRGRDVKRWQAQPSAHIIVTHEPGKRLNAIPENDMKVNYPKTYAYLKRFEDMLRERAAYKRYFRETAPFYSMFDVGDYTFAPYKVVWPWISTDLRVAVVGSFGGKATCPEHNTSFLETDNPDVAYFVCAALNSSIGDFTIRSFSSGGGGGIASPAVLQKIRIPKFDPKDKVHQELAALSEQAHAATALGEKDTVAFIEGRIDEWRQRCGGLLKMNLKKYRNHWRS